MKRLLFYTVLQVLSGLLGAQFVDAFSGAVLAEHWLGDTERFTITAGELQLNHAEAESNNETVLYALAPTSLAETTTWSFLVRTEFAPSSSNFARIYLATDQPPLPDAPLNGYYLQIGGISGANDAVELYRQDGNGSTLLLSGQAGAVGNDPALVAVAITRTSAGEWTLETDYTGGEDYEPEGSVVDNTYGQALFFGFYCRYTSTRSTNFFFDDVLIDPIVTDNDPPAATAVTAEDANTLRVSFNELLDPTSALTAANYTVDQGIGQPNGAAFGPGSQSEVILTFSTAFTNFTDYQLTAGNIGDISGNVLVSQEVGFSFLLPVEPIAGDLLITEIMADPSPPVGLPQEEYLELFNNSEEPLQLAGVQLSTGSSPRDLPAFLLLPGAYVTLCGEDVADQFAPFGDVLGMPSFPALTNGGSELLLSSSSGGALLSLTYDDSWYADDFKADGGYSLEMIDPNQASNCSGNWRASDDPSGGTPGRANSLLGSLLEMEAPNLLNAFAAAPTEITLRFDDDLDPNLPPEQFTISPGINIGDVLIGETANSLTLFLEQALSEGTIYTVTVQSGLTDCLGNPTAAPQSVDIGLAGTPEPGDLIINEILFNPYTGGVDFVELRNVSDNILEMRGLRLRNEAISSGTVSADVEGNFVLFPDSLVVFTPDPANILANYTVPNPAALVENGLPSLGDDEGNLSVYTPNFTLLDALSYTEDWHSPLLSDEDGVSLERLRADGPTQSSGNWYSAASVVGYATPTGVNSQNREGLPAQPEQDDFFTLPETTFSPDGDGFQDVLELSYLSTGAGFIADILIFDARGRPVRNLENQELLAGSGTFLWDGTTDEGGKARIGIYVILIELFTPEGETRQEKHTCVLAGQL